MTTPERGASPRREAATWRERAMEWAEETVEGGASNYIAGKTAEAVAQTLLAMRASEVLSLGVDSPCSESAGTQATPQGDQRGTTPAPADAGTRVALHERQEPSLV